MARLNRKIEYALVALKYMSGKIPGELSTAKEVSEKFNTPYDVTARVMQVLAQKGLLKSEHGALGGYFIARDLNRTSLNDLLIMLEGPSTLVKCISHDESCEVKSKCNIITPMSTLNDKLNEFYSSLKLKELLIQNVPSAKNTHHALNGQNAKSVLDAQEIPSEVIHGK